MKNAHFCEISKYIFTLYSRDSTKLFFIINVVKTNYCKKMMNNVKNVNYHYLISLHAQMQQLATSKSYAAHPHRQLWP